uniref:Uncharacterized protein n=1 Tax=Anguilla anguilla TaxID=7936 RepID=A0A0E9V7B5_ANGAN
MARQESKVEQNMVKHAKFNGVITIHKYRVQIRGASLALVNGKQPSDRGSERPI